MKKTSGLWGGYASETSFSTASLEIMNNEIDKFKWHKVDPKAAEELTTLTNPPGVVCPIRNSNLPEQIQKMTGVSSYYATGYTDIQVNSLGLVIGEMVEAI